MRTIGFLAVTGLSVLLLCLSASAALRSLSILGANKVDLLTERVSCDFQGKAEGYCSGEHSTADKAIRDAARFGFNFIRFAASGYAPTQFQARDKSDLVGWEAHQAAYWKGVDKLFDLLDELDLKVVPTFLWNLDQFPAISNEKNISLITNIESRSRGLFFRYVSQFVARYKDRRTVLFWEFSNELNLLADLDQQKRCLEDQKSPDECSNISNFSTQEMTLFSKDFVHMIKQHDPNRLISSGYGMPPRWAEHLSLRPEFGQTGADWTYDSIKEECDYILKIHNDFDIVSVHLYPDASKDRTRAGSVLQALQTCVRSRNKVLFVGEFGARVDDSWFLDDMRAAIKEYRPSYASVWAWEYYPDPKKPHPYTLQLDSDDERLKALNQLMLQAPQAP